jgi:hypothetical protein
MPLPRLPLTVLFLLLALVVVIPARAGAEIPLSAPRFGPASPAFHRFGAAVASSGRGYLVAWEERAMEYYPPGAIVVRALDAAGHPMQPAMRLLGGGVAPSIAWNGREYLVVWSGFSRFPAIVELPAVFVMRVAEDGTPIDSSPVVLAKQRGSNASTSVAWNGAEYLVGWSGAISGLALVTTDLQIRMIDVSSIGSPVSVASNGGDFLVAVSMPEVSGLALVTISPSGEIGAPRLVDRDVSGNASLTPVDGDYELLWKGSAGLLASRVTASSLGPATTITTATRAWGRIASMNGAILATWTESPHAPDDLAERICTERLDIASPPLCSEESGVGLRHDPAIGVASETFLLAWTEETGGIDDLRIDVTPKWAVPRVSGAGRIISEAAAAQGPPAIERRADGGVAAVWSEVGAVTRRPEVRIGGLDASGAVLPDRAVATTAHDQYDPQISAGNGRSLVTWTEVASNAAERIGTVVDDASGLASPPVTVAASSITAIAFDGREWLVASADSGQIRFVIVDRSGQITRRGSIDDSSNLQMNVAVAAAGDRFVIAWSAGGNGTTRIMTSQIANDGATAWQPSAPMLLDETATSAWSLNAPAVAINANRTLVSWFAQSNTPQASELRQALLDEHGSRAGANAALALAGSRYVYRLRSRPAPGGFALLLPTAVVLTSLDGRISGIIDLSATPISDFLVDAADRFTLAYNRAASGDENLGITSRAFLRTPEPARRRASKH